MDHVQTNLSEIRLPPPRWSIMYLRKSLTKFCPTLCLIVRIRSMSHRQARSELALRESELQQKVEEVADIMIMIMMIMIMILIIIMILVIVLMSKMVILIIVLVSKMVIVISMVVMAMLIVHL